MMFYNKGGYIELVTGSMFSGKSEELIKRVIRAKYAKRDVLVFNHCWDKRFKEDSIASHSGYDVKAIMVDSPDAIREIISKNKDVQIIAIDEAHFFGEDLIDLVEELADSGKRVIVSGLDQDFKGEPFNVISILLSKAESVDKLNAICSSCGALASRSQRIVNGKPAKKNDPLFLVGASECYEARCRKCHQVD